MAELGEAYNTLTQNQQKEIEELKKENEKLKEHLGEHRKYLNLFSFISENELCDFQYNRKEVNKQAREELNDEEYKCFLYNFDVGSEEESD